MEDGGGETDFGGGEDMNYVFLLNTFYSLASSVEPIQSSFFLPARK